MKQVVFIVFFIMLTLFYSVAAQGEIAALEKAGINPDSPLYIIDKVVEDITLAIKSGEDKAKYALAIKEEKIAEAIIMAAKEKYKEIESALLRANDVSDIISNEVGLELREKALESAEISAKVLEDLKEKLPPGIAVQDALKLVDTQLSKEEKIKLSVELVEKVATYCDRLAAQDYKLIEEDEHCDPKRAPKWLQKYIDEKIKERQKEAEKMLIGMLSTCVMNPRECDCSKIPVKSQQNECKQKTQLAIKCEYEKDMDACKQLNEETIVVPEGLPDFLKPIFKKTITALIEKKKREVFLKLAPPECVEAEIETPEECEEFMIEKYLPPECKEAGALTPEECNAFMQELYTPPEDLVTIVNPETGEIEVLPQEKAKKIVEEYSSKYVEEEISPTPKTEELREEIEKLEKAPEEVHEVEKPGLPKECKEAGVSGEECNALMEERYKPKGVEGLELPQECKDVGAITIEECNAIMGEIHEVK